MATAAVIRTTSTAIPANFIFGVVSDVDNVAVSLPDFACHLTNLTMTPLPTTLPLLVSKFLLGLSCCSAFHFDKTTSCRRWASYRLLRLILYLLAIFRFRPLCRWLPLVGEFIILLMSPVLPFLRVLDSQLTAFVRFQLSNFFKKVC